MLWEPLKKTKIFERIWFNGSKSMGKRAQSAAETETEAEAELLKLNC